MRVAIALMLMTTMVALSACAARPAHVYAGPVAVGTPEVGEASTDERDDTIIARSSRWRDLQWFATMLVGVDDGSIVLADALAFVREMMVNEAEVGTSVGGGGEGSLRGPEPEPPTTSPEVESTLANAEDAMEALDE